MVAILVRIAAIVPPPIGAPDASDRGMRILPLLALWTVSCGGASRGPRETNLGVAGHLEEAQRHEADATQLEREASEVSSTAAPPAANCVDASTTGQVTSGGERLIQPGRCGSTGSGVDARLREAAALHADAAAHRAKASKLMKAQRKACVGVTEAELGISAFAYVEDVLSVTALLDGAQLRGARVRFRKVEGLSAAWLLSSIECRQALGAAYGWDPTYLAYDPTVLDGVEVAASDESDGIVVEITAADEGTALVVYHRAESLLFPEE
jgi:hypothetical protein